MIWKHEIGKLAGPQLWARCWDSAVRVSQSAALTQSLYFLAHRSYVTPVKKAKWDSNAGNVCWSCKTTPGTLSHMILDCPNIQLFWIKVWERIQQILRFQAPLSWRIVIFRSLVDIPSLKATEHFLLDFMLGVALNIILKYWKDPLGLNWVLWWNQLGLFSKYERIHLSLGDSHIRALMKWKTLDKYVERSR